VLARVGAAFPGFEFPIRGSWEQRYGEPKGVAIELPAASPDAAGTPTPTPTPGGCAAKPLPNLTVPSKFDLGAPAPAASTEACCARCAAAAGCRAWTLNPKGACQLKSEAKFIYQSLYYSGRAV
jgi:hypothetical protein